MPGGGGQGAGMKIGSWAGFLPVVLFVAGCGNFWQDPYTTTTTTPACTTNCSTATSSNFYILNAGTTPQAAGYSIVSGTLTPLSGSPWTLLSTPLAFAIAPSGKFLFVSTIAGVFGYPITNGILGTAVTVSGDQDAATIQVDQSGLWLLEAMPGSDAVVLAAVPISSTTGAGTGTEYPVVLTIANAAVHQMAISKDNSYIFVALGAGGTIVVPFHAGAASGTSPFGATYTTIPVVNSSGSALSVAVDPSSTPRLFYIGETWAGSSGTTGGLRAFDYSSLGSSNLTQATGSPIASGGLAPNFILPVSTPDFVYVANGNGDGVAGNITGFAVTANGTTYSLTTGSTVAAGDQPLGLAEDSNGNFVMAVASLGSPYFDAYSFDATTTGQLDSQIISANAANYIAIVAAP
jgi:hypothetical protein